MPKKQVLDFKRAPRPNNWAPKDAIWVAMADVTREHFKAGVQAQQNGEVV